MNLLINKSNYANELTKLARNLSSLMEKRGIETKELSAITGVSVSSLNALKRGTGNPTLGMLITLSDYFGVSIGDLLSIKPRKSDDIKVIPVYSLSNSHLAKDSPCKNNIHLNLEHVNEKDLFAVTLNNSSLVPFFDKGSIFIVSEEKQYSDGDIVLIRINNENNAFRKVFITDNGLLFQHITPQSDPQHYKNYKVLGTVIIVIHELGVN